MRICPNCGEENPEKFRLCGFCGTPLVAELPAQEVRKTVTIVFSDLKGSTSLGEKLDSEALREVLGRYFDAMREVLELHGGRVEKYIGDAIMAVFGLPTLHEDDTLRAVRAAHDMQQKLAALNVELMERWGVTLTNRTGVNTGEVVAGDPTLGQRLVTGDAVNVAARLEQAAPALEILVGEPTYRIVRNAVEVEPVEPLELKGKSERVPAYRLISVQRVGEIARRSDGALVGRAEQLAALRAQLDACVADRTCGLATVLAEAGVGKSRLLEEFGRSLDGTLVLRGRCLSYGRGITFWPLTEIVRQIVGASDDDGSDATFERLVTVSGDRDVAERIASAAGLVAQQFPIDEVFWATRRLLERLAKDRPVVIVFEDIHWAEATLLDLIERVARSVADAPVLVICAARPTFVEIRPGGLDVPGSQTIELPPLSAEESALVVDSLLGTAEIDERARERIVSAAEGNPLYVEQLLSMLIDDGVLRREGERWSATVDLSDLQIPPTIHALLAARLDLLSREERAVIEPASVIGLYFAQQAVEELVPDVLRAEVTRHLAALSGKQLVQPGDVDVALGASFRFHHVLIRDTAYQALLKRTRATFHERFADWGERVNRELGRETEYEEILGYHLEQAYLYLADLGPVDDHGRTVAQRAADKLAAAGQRAFARDDMPAAANLLRRAVELLPEREPARLRLLPELGEALTQVGELAWAEVFLDEAIATAAELGDEGVGADARLVRLFTQGYGDGAGDDWGAEALREAARSVAIFERTSDHRRIARAWRLAGDVHGIASRFGEAATAAGHAAAHAKLAGDARQEARAASQHAMAAAYGPTPVAEAIELCERALAQPETTRRTKGLLMCLLARMKAKNGDFEEARDLYARARSTLEEVGGPLLAASTSMDSAAVELLAGDPEAAERELRRDYEALDRLGETLFRPTVAAYLARTLCIQGRYEEAADYAQVAEEVASPDDRDSQALWRCVKATILLQSGRLDEAEVLAQEAVEAMRPTDGVVKLADALVVLAAVYERQGRLDEGRRALAEALSLYERKGNIAALRAARATFFELSV